MKTILPDLLGLSLLLLLCAAIIVTSFVGIMFGSWLDGVVSRCGATGAPASWLAYFTGFCLVVAVVLSTLGRVITGEWWTE